MRIESNIREVIQQVEQLQERIPAAMQRALLAVAEPAERRFIQGFLNRLTVALTPALSHQMGEDGQGGYLVMRMWPPEPAGGVVPTLMEAQGAAMGTVNGRDQLGLFTESVAKAKELILQWVEADESQGGKKKDARDTGKSDDEVAQFISYIMLSPKIEKGSSRDAARQALTKHIAAFMAAQQQKGLPGDKVDLWLMAVLASWREMMRVQYPQLVRQELRKDL